MAEGFGIDCTAGLRPPLIPTSDAVASKSNENARLLLDVKALFVPERAEHGGGVFDERIVGFSLCSANTFSTARLPAQWADGALVTVSIASSGEPPWSWSS